MGEPLWCSDVYGFDGPSIGENRDENGFLSVAELGGTYCDVKENLLVSPVGYIIVVVASNFLCIKRPMTLIITRKRYFMTFSHNYNTSIGCVFICINLRKMA